MQRSDVESNQTVEQTITAQEIKMRHGNALLFLAGTGVDGLVSAQSAGRLHLNHNKPGHITEAEPTWSQTPSTSLETVLKNEFNQRAGNVVAAHNNNTVELIATILQVPSSKLIPEKIDIYITTGQKNIYQEVTYTHADKSCIVAKFQLVKKGGQWGYELQEIKTTKKNIRDYTYNTEQNSDTSYTSAAAAAAAAAAATAPVTTASSSSPAAAPNIPVPADVQAPSTSLFDLNNRVALEQFNKIKQSIEHITSMLDETPINQRELFIELQNILNAAMKIKIIANNKTSNPKEASNDDVLDQITKLISDQHQLRSEKIISVLAVIGEVLTGESGHNAINICVAIMTQLSLKENVALTLQYKDSLKMALQNIKNFQQELDGIEHALTKKISDETKITVKKILAAAKNAQCDHPENTVRITNALKYAKTSINSTDRQSERLQAVLEQMSRLSDPFATFLNENSDKLNNNITQYLSDTSQVALASRIFNEFNQTYSLVQPLIDAVVDAAQNNKLEDWISLALFSACTDLLDDKGELKPSLYRLLNENGKLDEFYAHNTKEKVNAQIIGGYIVEIVSSHAGKLVAAAFSNEQDNIDSTEWKTYLFSHLQNIALEQLSIINLAEKNRFKQCIVAMVGDNNYPAKNLQKTANNIIVLSNLEQAIKNGPNHAVNVIASNVLFEARRVARSNNRAHIIDAINATTAVVNEPTNISHINRLQTEAKTFIGKRPWGKILAATMLALAGVALIAASTAVALISFGALAPVSILGFTLAASSIAGGVAIGTGVIGLGAAAGGAALFAKDIKKPRTKLADEMTSLAKQAKPRT